MNYLAIKTIKEYYPSDWNETNFQDLFEFESGLSISRANLSDEGICYLHYGDIHKTTENFVNVEKDYDLIPKYDITLDKVNEKYLLKEGDIVFADASEDYAGIGKSVVVINPKELPFISGLHTIVAKDKTNKLDNGYKKYFLTDWNIRKQLMVMATGISVYGLSKTNLKKIRVVLPPKEEQQKIAFILSTWDKAIELKEKLIEQKKEQKKGLMQKLLTGEVRFPGYDGKWQKVDFEEVFIRIPVKKYQIKTTEYLKSGQFPVIDQGKQKIVAYSNNAEKVYQVESKGVIVFGDHTRERKFIDFDFIVGADGTQVLDTNDGYNNKFYFYWLLHQNIPNTGYNRHFKFLKEMWFFKPSLNEQVKIAEILSKIDKEIDLINKELEELKHQKQGLMQQLLTGKIRVKV